jgi:hypothetical protein
MWDCGRGRFWGEAPPSHLEWRHTARTGASPVPTIYGFASSSTMGVGGGDAFGVRINYMVKKL